MCFITFTIFLFSKSIIQTLESIMSLNITNSSICFTVIKLFLTKRQTKQS